MDERVLGPTREAALEEITECRQKMGTLLVIYFIVILLLVLYGGGNLLFLIVVAAAGGGCAWGKILYVALPMFLWFYSQGANTSGRILMLYSVLEEIQVCIAMYVLFVAIPFLPVPGGYVRLLLLAAFGGWVGLTLLFIGLFRSARRLGKLIFASGVGDRIRAGRLDVVMVVVIIICYLAPALPDWGSTRSSMTLKSQLKQSPEVEVHRAKEAIDRMAASPPAGQEGDIPSP